VPAELRRARLARAGERRGRRDAGRALWATLLLALAVGWGPAPAPAGADVGASVHPSFLPDALGARTAFSFALRLRGPGEDGVPPPVRRMVIHLPAGLGIDLSGAPSCRPARLRRSGPRGCPPGSLVGRGHATLAVHAGSQSIPEQAVVQAFRAPDRGGRPALMILSRGDTPLQQQTLSTGSLAPDRPPYGLKLIVSVPPIPTLVLEPEASIVSFSLTVGSAGARPRAHTAAGTVTVPRRCPAGGFPFAADFSFSDFTASRAAARIPCP